MATGFRIVRHSNPLHEGWVDYGSTKPAFEGDVITEPNTTVSEQFWVWSDFQRLAYLCVFQTYYLEEDIPKSPRRLLVVD